MKLDSNSRPSRTRTENSGISKAEHVKCEHVAEKGTTERVEESVLVADCKECGSEIVSTEIDKEYLEDSGEIVVLNWERL